MVVESKPEYDIVFIGEDFDDHFARQASLKILRTGEVFKQSDPTGLDDGWIIEYPQAETQLELTEAAAVDAKKADGELKAVYERLLSGTESVRLAESEAAWLEYRKKKSFLMSRKLRSLKNSA